MTEVRASPSGHLGLFALQDFSSGDVIFEEEAVVKLAPSGNKSSRELLSEWLHGLSKEGTGTKVLWDSIKPPPSNLVPDYLRGTFKGMVQAGIVFMKKYHGDIEPKKLEALLQLYYPTKESTSEAEKAIINVADEAILFLKQHVTTSKTTGKVFSGFEDWDKLHKILLIWACNSFQGGRIYPEISRVNHSCNPNAVIQTTNTGEHDKPNKEGQKVVAATKIEKGSEIFISYLGMLLYTDTAVRQKKLERTKYFTCVCTRCSDADEEGAAQIPCPIAHPRDPHELSLDEDTQYDDDQTVKYTTFIRPKNAKAFCNSCKDATDQETLFKVLQGVCNKTEMFLDTYDNRQANNENTDEEELEENASLTSTMMGDKHWTSNLSLLLHLDRRLKAMSQQMVITQEMPDDGDIAEAIDSLQRITRFVDSLKLDMDPAHLLGDVTIGIARMLISLGDEKSQKYGAEWLNKIEDYVNQFSDKGVQKVVSVLKVAWKKHERSSDDDDIRKKKKKAKHI
uniref:SET domain-containing protein n=1 Tax=Pseudo-nitzschia delicatissima TaxID=44447 RepID=A0A7S0XLQ3_9STRA|mmetsp:Transcript_202/g.473  ORF Transcript_202/g.473 Transcript_202/m.473 type:complete len:509 (+) Transcript_202:79-1605(+)